MRDGFGADRLACAWGAGEIEGERETGWMPLAETPAVEDQIMLGHLCQRRIERIARRWRQDDVLERPPSNDGFRRAPPRHTEELGDRRGHHPNLTCTTQGCSWSLAKILRGGGDVRRLLFQCGQHPLVSVFDPNLDSGGQITGR